jgi:carbon monoxide dehydrogenase subunit G
VAATQSRALPGFSSLDLAGSNRVTVHVGGQQSVVVHADSNLMRHVTTRVVAGTLVIGTTGTFTTRSPMTVDVSLPSLTAVRLSGSGEISVDGIDEQRLVVTLSGSGALYASGTTTQLDVTLSGSGMAQLDTLVARNVRAVVAGSGLIRVTATALLNAAVPGSGAIIYGGNPQVTSSVTGSGAVTQG